MSPLIFILQGFVVEPACLFSSARQLLHWGSIILVWYELCLFLMSFAVLACLPVREPLDGTKKRFTEPQSRLPGFF